MSHMSIYRILTTIIYFQKFWRLGTNGIRGEPTEIHKFWYNLPSDGIDAIYERTDGKIVFFKGTCRIDLYELESDNKPQINI